MKIEYIDNGNSFDFGKVSKDYALYRDVYPKSMYDKLISFGIGKKGQNILDLGSGTAVLPINMHRTGAHFVSTDVSENQIDFGRKAAAKKGIFDIDFKVCSAEETGFDEGSFDVVTAVQCFHYFDAEKAAQEIYRILKPQGIFCKIFMDWLPYEDEKIDEMEKLVVKYNPFWNGGGFKEYNFEFPKWAQGRFDVKAVYSYDTQLEFSKEAWIGRIKSCRGVGASLSEEKQAEFLEEYRSVLEKYGEPLELKHQIHIEVYSKKGG